MSSSPKLLGGLTGNTDATGSPKHPQSVNPHRAAAQPTHPGRAHSTIFIIHGAAQLPLQLLGDCFGDIGGGVSHG